MKILIVLMMVAALALSACGGVGTTISDTSSPAGEETAEELGGEDAVGDSEGGSPAADSPEGYGAIEKFNEFSVSILTVLVDNLEGAIDGMGFSVSKAFYGDLSGIDCDCSYSADVLSCSCDSVNGGSCEGSAWHSEDRELINASLSCDDFHLFEDTVFEGSFSALVSISAIMREVLGNSFGGFFASKSLGEDGGSCAISEDGICQISGSICLVSLASAYISIGEEGFGISDECGNFSFGAGSYVTIDLCLNSLTSFYTTFSIEGMFNDQPADMTSTIECDVEGIASF